MSNNIYRKCSRPIVVMIYYIHRSWPVFSSGSHLLCDRMWVKKAVQVIWNSIDWSKRNSIFTWIVHKWGQSAVVKGITALLHSRVCVIRQCNLGLILWCIFLNWRKKISPNSVNWVIKLYFCTEISEAQPHIHFSSSHLWYNKQFIRFRDSKAIFLVSSNVGWKKR